MKKSQLKQLIRECIREVNESKKVLGNKYFAKSTRIFEGNSNFLVRMATADEMRNITQSTSENEFVEYSGQFWPNNRQKRTLKKLALTNIVGCNTLTKSILPQESTADNMYNFIQIDANGDFKKVVAVQGIRSTDGSIEKYIVADRE